MNMNSHPYFRPYSYGDGLGQNKARYKVLMRSTFKFQVSTTLLAIWSGREFQTGKHIYIYIYREREREREREFQLMTSASDDNSLSSDQDTNRFLV